MANFNHTWIIPGSLVGVHGRRLTYPKWHVSLLQLHRIGIFLETPLELTKKSKSQPTDLGGALPRFSLFWVYIPLSCCFKRKRYSDPPKKTLEVGEKRNPGNWKRSLRKISKMIMLVHFYECWRTGNNDLYAEYTLQGINISHLGKRKIIFKMPFFGDMLVPWRVVFKKCQNCLMILNLTRGPKRASRSGFCRGMPNAFCKNSKIVSSYIAFVHNSVSPDCCSFCILCWKYNC